MTNIFAGDASLTRTIDDEHGPPLPRGLACPEHGRLWLRQGKQRQLTDRGEMDVRVYVCTHGNATSPRICGHITQEET
jgi:hypothetical protein